jgi:hypothetical protein
MGKVKDDTMEESALIPKGYIFYLSVPERKLLTEKCP